jgi:hypothetical protein
MRKSNLPILLLAVVLIALGMSRNASASSALFFEANETYRTVHDSPFWTGAAAQNAGNFRMENFEDGLVNTLGLKATGGSVRGPGSGTDSVDGDGNHVLDGRGTGGSSYQVRAQNGNRARAVFTFDRQALGHLPTFAGLVWTDGRRDATVVFKAYDAAGNMIARIAHKMGDSSSNGTTAEDRFLGASFSRGIAKITITASIGNFEIDHLQFGFNNFAMAVVPVPPALGLGLVGLVTAGFARRRFMRAAA